MSTETLRHHPKSARNDLKGVAKSTIVTSDAYVTDGAELPDALDADSEVANKPGSSIPSIFGRMIFFRTALKNVKNGKKNSHVSPANKVYNQIVSQWLDLMELVFNQSRELTFEQWNAERQIKALRDSQHKELADAFDKHTKKYFRDWLKDIYLIYHNGKLVGGTSPYSFVFTSPNWTSGKEPKSLLKRETKFRKFIYKLYLAVSGNRGITHDVYDKSGVKLANPCKEVVEGFISYVGDCLDNEDDTNLKDEIKAAIGRYTKENLDSDYDVVKAKIDDTEKPITVATLYAETFENGKQVPLKAVSLNLYGRPMGQIESDFFIDSDFHKAPEAFDAAALPLVLVQEDYPDFMYYDNVRWNSDTKVPQIENQSEDPKRKMPDCSAYVHNWLTTIDFLDDKIISLPYEMDDQKFANVTNINGRSYLLPIKPKALKYFTVKSLKAMIQTKMEDGELVVTLNMPIRNNSGSRRNTLALRQKYDLKNDVVAADEIGLDERPLSIGISPFVKLPKDKDNVYNVMLQYPPEGGCNISLAFYTGGSDKPVGQEYVKEKTREHLTVAKFYSLKRFTFDAIEVKMSKDGDDVYGMVIPNFKDVSDGQNQYVYSIDFGTTNTHVAFIGTNEDTATSFGSKEISEQVQYLAKTPNEGEIKHHGGRLAEFMMKVYGSQSLDTLIDQAREFFPNFVGDDYSFPIRTAAFIEQTTGGISPDGLFGELSIGFRYPKEVIQNPNYHTRLKWDLNSYKETDADARAKLFFEELLGMIRNHWISRDGVQYTIPPTIVLTFPLAMGSNKARIQRLWYETYKEVFGEDRQPDIKELAESLAPALSLINSGNLSVSGILNVDIGGGTTDIQYYRAEGATKVGRYNSVLFAGDDLWGCGFENLPLDRAVKENIFTRFADERMAGKTIELGLDQQEYNSVGLVGKEKINLLLRDKRMQFSNMISDDDNGANDDARLVVMLHYAALLYHVVNWMKGDSEMAKQFPAVINFTGYGSKYIESIFGRGQNDKLTLYTEKLLKAFGVENLPSNFTVKFSDNPKAVTAEGAALYGKNSRAYIPQRPVLHYGYADSDSTKVVKYKEIEGLSDKVYDYFLKFLEGFKAVEDTQLSIPRMTDDKEAKFKDAAMLSFRQTADSLHSDKDKEGNNPVTDSMFFWMLKGSLYDFDKL